MALSLSLFVAEVFLIFCAIIAIHEAGHYVAAWRLHVPVQKLYLGIGPLLVNTNALCLRALPLGGAIDIDDSTWNNLPLETQKKIAVAGPAVTVIAGLLALPFSRFMTWICLTTAIGNLFAFQGMKGDSDGKRIIRGWNKPARAAWNTFVVVFFIITLLSIFALPILPN